MTLLETVLEAKRQSISSKKGQRVLKELKSRIADREGTRPFQKAITRDNSNSPRLIAEIKKASPSKGILREKFDPVEIAMTYAGERASALSILTEEDFFMGRLSYLDEVRSAVSLPILQKDFILDEIQIYEARAYGADAILLIAALLTRQQAIDYFHLATHLQLAALVEVHTLAESESVLDWATIIGINNRDLITFKTDIHTTARLMREISPAMRKEKIFVSESGITLREDIEFLNETGVDALLIGETFMVSGSIQAKMRALFGEGS
ncbi:MAG: indole-3-glycerol phosphate synthase TrpC [Nitrospirae bacterium]|nr:indole-3-glycerol phosphate synthase TrpC [Candidatus Troglogloeales bacterium]